MTDPLNVKKSSLKLSPGLELRATTSKGLGLQKSPVQTQAATWEAAAANRGDTALGLATKELLVQCKPAYTTLSEGQSSTSPQIDVFPVLNNFSLTLQPKAPYQSPLIITIPVHTRRSNAQGVHLSRANLSHVKELLLHQSLICTQQEPISTPDTLLWILDATKLSCGKKNWYIYKNMRNTSVKWPFSLRFYRLNCFIWRILMELHSCTLLHISHFHKWEELMSKILKLLTTTKAAHLGSKCKGAWKIALNGNPTRQAADIKPNASHFIYTGNECITFTHWESRDLTWS